ncbi:MAG: LON peptidase substrate-binding domain-containing protein [bacterium]
MSDELLPLFPLQVVLFPNSVLPLHVFEDRYKQLIDGCWIEGSEFGINLLRENEIVKVGCSAVVTKVVKKYDDGKMDVFVQGRRRYRLLELVDSANLYSVGRVEILHSKEEVIDTALATETVRLHNQLVDLVYKDKGFAIEYDGQHPEISFTIALKAGMDLTQRQLVLEVNSENERLKTLHQYLSEVIPKLHKVSEVERLIASDGYDIN